MSQLAADLDRTYAPRLAEFVSDERFGEWRCKLLHQRSFIGATIAGLEPVEWTPAAWSRDR